MEIKTAEFVISNTDYKVCPPANIPEYAFIGRSNVGKSSLINALSNSKKLAKTSAKPGKTKLINHFLINKKWYLVDLPGYGFAKISQKIRTNFLEMTRKYLQNRSNLICLFVLIDCRHKPQQIDQEFMQWLAENNLPFCITFTKADKTSKIMLKKNIEKYKLEMLKTWEYLPAVFITSAVKKKGLDKIIKYIEYLNTENLNKL